MQCSQPATGEANVYSPLRKNLTFPSVFIHLAEEHALHICSVNEKSQYVQTETLTVSLTATN